MKIKEITLLFCTLITLSVSSQVYDPSPESVDVMKFKQNILVAVLMETDSTRLVKLYKGTDTTEAYNYKKRIADYNSNIREVIPKYFTMYKELQFKTMREIFALPLTERKRLSFFAYNSSGEGNTSTSTSGNYRANSQPMTVPTSSGGVQYNMNYNSGMGRPAASDMSYSAATYYFYSEGEDQGKYYSNIYKTFDLSDDKNDFAILELFLHNPEGETGKKSVRIFWKNMPGKSLTKGELAYFFLQTELAFNNSLSGIKVKNADIKANNPLLKAKTLVVLRDNLSKDVSEADIQKVYPYSFKIVDRNEFDTVIMERSEKYAYLMILPFARLPQPITGTIITNHFQAVVDASTGKCLSYAASAVAGSRGLDEIKAKHFEKHIKNVD